MKREIKFRGQCLTDGVWYYGSYVYLPDSQSHHIIPCGTYKPHMDLFEVDGVEVDPETISQYTGVKDRNGVEIYEGDIIHFHFKHHVFPDTFDERHHIYWCEIVMKLMYDNLTNPNTAIDSFAETLYIVRQEGSKCWIEVIGNEYDNPELLEELDV